MTTAFSWAMAARALAGFTAIWLLAACSSSPDRAFAECEQGWLKVDGECQQTCEMKCPNGQQCSEGLCVECPDGICPTCGDGLVTESETCDDGNTDPGDGCSDCVVEDHWKCSKTGPSKCECAAGYQDEDKDGVCAADCAGAALDCGARGACTDASGTAHCECDPGYQDNDNSDGCKPDCDTAMLHCGEHAGCSDRNGTATCVCDPAHQDNDENGECLPDCSQTDCGENASCDDTSGTATCTCDEGFQDKDEDGKCGEDCSELDCGESGSCDDASGTPTCSCDPGYQDNDGKDGCAPDCETAAVDCKQNQHCDDSSGTAACACDADYQDNDGKDGCSPTCAKANLTCGIHATCDDSSGVAACMCDAHYRDPGDDGACELATCYLNPSSCGATNYCALDTESCSPVPKVPNGDFSCKSGGVCDVSWDLESGITIGNDCGGGLTFTPEAFISSGPGIIEDVHATVSVSVPEYATIDPPTANAGPFAIAVDIAPRCVDGSVQTCAQSNNSGNDKPVSLLIGGRYRRTLNMVTTNCTTARRVVCLDATSYGTEATLDFFATATEPGIAPFPRRLPLLANVDLVRDPSCPVPGVVPFAPGDWAGQVGGDGYIAFNWGSDCAGYQSASADLSWPNDLARPALELELTASPDDKGVLPRLDVNVSPTAETIPIATHLADTEAPTTLRACLPPWLGGQISSLQLTGRPMGQDCDPVQPKLRIRKVAMVDATAEQCPSTLFENVDFSSHEADMMVPFNCRDCQLSDGAIQLEAQPGTNILDLPVRVPAGPNPAVLVTLSRTGTLAPSGYFSLSFGSAYVSKQGDELTTYLSSVPQQKCLSLKNVAGTISSFSVRATNPDPGVVIKVDDVKVVGDQLCP